MYTCLKIESSIKEKKKEDKICLLCSPVAFLGFPLTCSGGLVLILFLWPRHCVNIPGSDLDDSSNYVRGACCLSACVGSSTPISLADCPDLKGLKLKTGTVVNYNRNSSGAAVGRQTH